MDGQRQHLEHEKIPNPQPHLQDLRDATLSINQDRWIADATMDKLDKGELTRLSPVINSLVGPYKPPHSPLCNIYRFKRPKKVAPSDLDIIIPLHILGDTKPMLAAKDNTKDVTKITTVELLVGNVYWIKDVAVIQPDVVLLWVGTEK